MSVVKRIARHVLRDELAEMRLQAIKDEDRNVAGILRKLAGLYGGDMEQVSFRRTDSLADWEKARYR